MPGSARTPGGAGNNGRSHGKRFRFSAFSKRRRCSELPVPRVCVRQDAGAGVSPFPKASPPFPVSEKQRSLRDTATPKVNSGAGAAAIALASSHADAAAAAVTAALLALPPP
ncbi:unnamed protein product [Lampetra planeri]